jgi:RNA polymerase sigma factor (sigma-70 family)
VAQDSLVGGRAVGNRVPFCRCSKGIGWLVTCTVVTVLEPGSPQGFDDWYRCEWPRLVATFTLASGDWEVGREIAAETCARALERWERVSRMVSPGGWAYRVGLNLLRRHYRRLLSERRALKRIDVRPESGELPDDGLDLWIAVAGLPVRERAAVILRYGAGMTEPEIASVLGVAAGTVSATLNHARTRLRSVLGEPIEEVPGG